MDAKIEAMAREAGLPPLPEADDLSERWLLRHVYTADQMREYAGLVRADALEEAAKACEARVSGPMFGLAEGEAEAYGAMDVAYEECAEMIRALIAEP